MDKIDKDDVAMYATANSSIISAKKTINIQLNDWIKAKELFKKEILYKQPPSYEDMVTLINYLGNSLLALFGMHYNKGKHTPALMQFINEKDKGSGYSLEKEDNILFKRLELLNEDYNRFSKHISSTSVLELSKIDKAYVQKHMETTRLVWIWWGKKLYNENVPEKMLIEFKEVY